MSLKMSYRKSKRKKAAWIAGLFSLIVSMVWMFSILGLNVSVDQPGKAIWQYITGSLPYAGDRDLSAIILTMRIPRVLLAICSGFVLAVSGTVMQAITRNELVSPFTVGISAASAFGASLAIVLGAAGVFQVVGTAFFVAMLCMMLLYGLVSRVGITPGNIILVGISLNYLFGALTELIRFFAKGYQLESMVQWSFGTLDRADWYSVLILWIVIVAAFSLLYHYAPQLDVMAHNEDDVSHSLGINSGHLRIITGSTAVFMTATVICFTGVIGFVGLIAPHMARILIGGTHKWMMPFSGLLGAVLMMIADTIGHHIFPPNDIPVSIVLSFIGVPLFINLVLQRRKSHD